jgi:hypothetical protein
MRPFRVAFVLAAGIVVAAGSIGLARPASNTGPYKVLKTAKAGGEGGFDYIFADAEGRRLYVPRNGAMGQLMVFNLDTLEPAGTIPGIRSGGATVDPKSHHGFSTSQPVTMWDSTTLKVIKTIGVDGRPDGILFDPYNERVWVFSKTPPYATVIDAKEGAVVGTLDLGGGPKQAVSDGKGTVYVNISTNANIAVVDAKNIKVTAHYDVSPKAAHCGGLAFDVKNHILFAYCRLPTHFALIVNAENGKIITTLPTGEGVDTVEFNPATMEAISAEDGGTMTFIKENSPTSFEVEQTLDTKTGAKTLALDTKANHLLTMTADFEPPPPGAPRKPGDRPPRGPMVPGSFSVLMIGK